MIFDWRSRFSRPAHSKRSLPNTATDQLPLNVCRMQCALRYSRCLIRIANFDVACAHNGERVAPIKCELEPKAEWIGNSNLNRRANDQSRRGTRKSIRGNVIDSACGDFHSGDRCRRSSSFMTPVNNPRMPSNLYTFIQRGRFYERRFSESLLSLTRTRFRWFARLL